MKRFFYNAIMPMTVLCMLLFVQTAKAGDPKVSLKFGKGLNIVDADSTMSFNLSFAMQNRLDVAKVFEDGSKATTLAQVRRLRLFMKGFAFTPKLEYNIQLGFSPADIKTGIVYDAFLRYSPVKELGIQFGQGKLPGNREEMTGDPYRQFIESSAGTTLFRLERDFGLQLLGKVGKKVIFKPTFSVATGEGKNFITANLQHFDYTFRAELQPLGEFKNKGDYSGGDLVREEKPKLAIAAAFDFNNKAASVLGQLGGDIVPDSVGKRNVQTLFADMIFKYSGFAVSGEYAYRFVEDNINHYNNKTLYITGQSFWVSGSYDFKKNYETAFRFARSFPGDNGTIGENNQYTLAFAKYFKDHNLKVQTDYTLTDDKKLDKFLGVWRFQMQIVI